MPRSVRIDPATYAVLRRLARESHRTVTETLALAVRTYEREVFFLGLAADFASLRADPEQWAEDESERAIWDQTD